MAETWARIGHSHLAFVGSAGRHRTDIDELRHVLGRELLGVQYPIATIAVTASSLTSQSPT
jgi:hypothetical protein